MGYLQNPPTFNPPVAPISLGANGTVLTMVGGRPQFSGGGPAGSGGLVLGKYVLGAPLVAGANNDYNPVPVAVGGNPVWPNVVYGRMDLDASAGNADLTGMVAAFDGQFLLLRAAVANTIVVHAFNGGSAAANRFLYSNDIVLANQATLLVCYYGPATGINGGAGGWIPR